MVRAFLKTYKTKYLLGFKPKVMMGEDIDESPSSPVQMCLFLFFINDKIYKLVRNSMIDITSI